MTCEQCNAWLGDATDGTFDVERHAQATQVRLRVSPCEGGVLLEIEDDGVGIDPAVVNAQRSLGLLGACTMGTSGAHNPTLTAQALAWRTGEYLAKNWKSVARTT